MLWPKLTQSTCRCKRFSDRHGHGPCGDTCLASNMESILNRTWGGSLMRTARRIHCRRSPLYSATLLLTALPRKPRAIAKGSPATLAMARWIPHSSGAPTRHDVLLGASLPKTGPVRRVDHGIGNWFWLTGARSARRFRSCLVGQLRINQGHWTVCHSSSSSIVVVVVIALVVVVSSSI